MAILLHCPTCRRQLNVPDDLRGRKVKCAECQTVFDAVPADEPPAVAGTAPSFGEAAPPGYAATASGISLVAPACILIFLAVVTGLIGVYFFASGVNAQNMTEAELKQTHEEMMKLMQMFQQPNQPPIAPELRDFNKYKEMIQNSAPYSKGFGIYMGVCALIVLLGGVQMLRLKSQGFCRFASVIALIPITSPCCILGIPVGIWSLVALSKPEVTAAFQANSR